MHSNFSVVSHLTWTNYMSYRGVRKGAWSEADQKVYLVQCPHSIEKVLILREIPAITVASK